MKVLAIECTTCGNFEIQAGKRWRVGVKTYPLGSRVVCGSCGAMVEVEQREFSTWQEREGL